MKKLLFLFVILFSISLQAQDLDEVFDDGGLSKIKNNVNFSISDLIGGNLGIGYDRYLGKHTSLGVNVGIFLYNGPNLFLFYGDMYQAPSMNTEFDKGFIFHFRFRRFNFQSDGLYWQYGFTIQSKSNQDSKFDFVSFPDFKFGYNYPLTERLILSASVGIGLASAGISNINTKPGFNIYLFDGGGIYLPFDLELHYDF